MYAAGSSVAEIEATTGVGRTLLPVITDKCLSLDKDGRIKGYRALIPYKNSKPYIRTAEVKGKFPDSQGGSSGLFANTLKRFPELEKKLLQHIKKTNSPRLNVHEKRIRAKDLHRIFISYLRNAGVSPTDWPFNTRYLGLRTIQKYLNWVLDNAFERGVVVREERAAIAHLSVGTGYESLLKFEEPYDLVELDGYFINAFFTTEFATPEGTIKQIHMNRVWLLAMVDKVSNAILAQSFIFRSQVSASDVISLIRKALNPPEKINITIPGIQYPKNGGLPAEIFPECIGAIWGLFSLDNALAHLSKAVHYRARNVLGYSLNWGPVGHFERRPEIERYFSTISNEMFMRFSSTTGSNPQKGRAKNPESNAVKYKINVEEVEQVVAVVTAQHNATPNEGTSYNSPLDVLRYYISGRAEHFLLRHLPTKPGSGRVVMPLILKPVVRGGRASGRHPYVQIEGVRYTNPVLAQSAALIGQRLTIEIDEEDMRFCKAYLPNGAELGILKAEGRWCESKHNLKTREAINKLRVEKILVVSTQQDPVQQYLNYLSTPKKRHGKQKRLTPSQTTEAHRVSKESGLPRQELNIRSSNSSIEPSLSDLKQSRPTLIDKPIPDLNELMKRKGM